MSMLADLEAIHEKFKAMEETRIDVILLTTVPLEVMLRTKHKGQWYAILNKGLFEKEVKPELVKMNLTEPVGDKPAYIPLPLTSIPVIEDDNLAFEVALSKLDELYQKQVDNLFAGPRNYDKFEWGKQRRLRG